MKELVITILITLITAHATASGINLATYFDCTQAGYHHINPAQDIDTCWLNTELDDPSNNPSEDMGLASRGVMPAKSGENGVDFLIAEVSIEKISNMSFSEIANLSENQVSFLTNDQVSAMSARQISWLSKGQVQALPPSQTIIALQISAVNPKGFISLFKLLSDAQSELFIVALAPNSIRDIPESMVALLKISTMTLEQIKGMTKGQLKNIQLEQIRLLSTSQLAAIIKSLSPAQISMLHKSINLAQIAELSQGYNEAQLRQMYGDLTRDQIQGLLAVSSQNGIQNLLNKITPSQLNGLINGLGRNQIELISSQRLTSLPTETLKGLSQEQLSAFPGGGPAKRE